MNKFIQKKYHGLTGHQQSIEYHTVAQNKTKLYFNSNSFMNLIKLNLNGQKQLNQVKTELKEELKVVNEGNFRAEQSSSHNKSKENEINN